MIRLPAPLAPRPLLLVWTHLPRLLRLRYFRLLNLDNDCAVRTYSINMTMVSCQKGPTRHAYAWQIGPLWLDTLDKDCYGLTYSIGLRIDFPSDSPGRAIVKRYTYFMMTSWNGNIFRVTVHLCGEFTSPRWNPRTKASDAELLCFLWSASE